MISQDDIKHISGLPIEQVAEALGLSVTRHMCLCVNPEHNDTRPSLHFNTRTNSCHCFACSMSADSIKLVQQVLNLSFRDAVCWLAQTFNVQIHEVYLPFKDVKPREVKPQVQEKVYPPDVKWLKCLMATTSLNAEARHFLFDVRKYKPKVVEWLGIKSINSPQPCYRSGHPFYDAPSLLFPYKDIDGELLSVQSRYLGEDKDKPRFKFPKGSTCHVFNLPILRYMKPDEPLYISEGITDCIALLSSGKRAIAIPSATLLKPKDLELLKGRDLHIYPDNDAPGQELYRQLVRVATDIGSCLIKHQLPDDCKDYSDYYLKISRETRCLNLSGNII